MDLEHIRLLADAQLELPPIIVHRPTMRVIDGMHRLHAAKLRGRTEISARFFDGDETEAFVLAVRANIAHGLPLSLADRKAAAARIVLSHPRWSDRLIASITGLAAKTIAEIRRRHLTDEAPETDVRVGRDGRLRPVNSTEGRRIAAELMLKDPNLSLRQVAKAAGISPETARDVRGRLSRGEDPTLPRQRRQNPGGAGPRETPRRTGELRAPGRQPVLQRLRADPALRFSETGRTLLRLLDVHAMSEENWARIIDNVPAHCRETIVHAALETACIWKAFADRLDQAKRTTA